MTFKPEMRESEQAAVFTDGLRDVAPLRLIEPLARTLGAFDGDSAVIEYSYVDVVKMAGHACPTTAMAYECCRHALGRLYPGGIPVRGEITVTIHGEPDDGVYGVIGQVFSLITGAAAETGFKGLATFFKRKDLLTYDPSADDGSGNMTCRFARMDNGTAVRCRVLSDRMPSPSPENGRRLGILIKKVLWDAAKENEIQEFRALWRHNVVAVLESSKQDPPWLVIEEEK